VRAWLGHPILNVVAFHPDIACPEIENVNLAYAGRIVDPNESVVIGSVDVEVLNGIIEYAQ
jgi:hypothetical protein